MRRRWIGLVTVALLVACHRNPAPTYEYDETVTYTSTENDPAPQVVGDGLPGAAGPAVSPPATAPPAAAKDAPPTGAAAYDEPAAPAGGPTREDEWTTTVNGEPAGADERGAAPATTDAPAAAAKTPAPAADATVPAPSPSQRWYKAKTW